MSFSVGFLIVTFSHTVKFSHYGDVSQSRLLIIECSHVEASHYWVFLCWSFLLLSVLILKLSLLSGSCWGFSLLSVLIFRLLTIECLMLRLLTNEHSHFVTSHYILSILATESRHFWVFSLSSVLTNESS